MNTAPAIVTFEAFSVDEKIEFLIRLSHEVTIVARDCYETGETGLTNPHRIRLLNEVQHRVTGFLQALLKGSSKRYPDDVLVRIILEHPEDAELEQQLQSAFCRLTHETSAAA